MKEQLRAEFEKWLDENRLFDTSNFIGDEELKKNAQDNNLVWKAYLAASTPLLERIAQLTQRLEQEESLVKLLHESMDDDKELLDWLGVNFYSRDMDDFDAKLYPNSWMWVFFAPKKVQSDIRRVLKAAKEREDTALQQKEQT